MFSNISLHITLIRVQTPHLAIETDKLEFFFPLSLFIFIMKSE